MRSAILSLTLMATGCGFYAHGNGDVETRTVKVSSFDGLFNGTLFDVTVQEGPAGKVQLTCDSNLLDLMAVEVVDDELRIHKTIMGGMQPTADCFAVVNVPENHDLDALRNSGSGDVTSDLTLALEELTSNGSGDIQLAVIDSDELDLRVSGSGDVDLLEVSSRTLFVDSNGSGDVRIDRLTGDFVSDQSGSGSVDVRDMDGRFVDGRIRGSGDLDVEGVVDHVEIQGSGSGSFTFLDVDALTADVRLSGSGDAHMVVREEVTGRLSGSGSLFLFGNPDSVQVSTSGSGDVVLKRKR